jgi:N-methylhydantoinase A
MKMDTGLAEKAVQTIADALSLPLKKAAEGIYNIVNENMFGALRLVSVEQGYDPRNFALVAFGGAGPLHANALGKLMGSWPVIVPPGPGVLCAAGDATTRLRDEASRTLVVRFDATSDRDIERSLEELANQAAQSLAREGVERTDLSFEYELDLRYAGQGTALGVTISPDDFRREGLKGVASRFDKMHEQMFTFNLDQPHELLNLRAVVQGRETIVAARQVEQGNGDPARAVTANTTIFFAGKDLPAKIYARDKLRAGDRIPGPAIVTEMDSTTLILPDHYAEVDRVGSMLIRPVN